MPKKPRSHLSFYSAANIVAMSSLRVPIDHHSLDRQAYLIRPGAVDANDREVYNIVIGRLDNLPPITSRLVKVFLSSTFSDMVKERDFLMEFAYPDLKEFCRQKHGLEFQMMDLRWGIQDQSRIDHTTFDICMEEIDNCRHHSVGPSFVLFLGQKYGYRPIPATIKDTEFEAIRGALQRVHNDSVALLDTWYKKDTNRIPAYYQLQPISSVLCNIENQVDKQLRDRDEAEWNNVFNALQLLLRQGAALASAVNAAAVTDIGKYTISVTESEINRGLVEHPTPRSHCLMFERNIVNLVDCLSYDRAHRFVDMKTNNGTRLPDTEAMLMQDQLKQRRLSQLLDPSNVACFDIEWTNPDSRDPSDDSTYLAKFCKLFVEMMRRSISQAVDRAAGVVGDANVREIAQHLTMCRARCEAFVGRETEMEAVRKDLEDGCLQPIIVHGCSGSGKTSVMAKVASLVPTWFADSGVEPVVVVRFLGTTARSSSVGAVLSSLCWQIAMAYKQDVMQIPPSDSTNLVDHFHALLKAASEVGSGRPLIMVLDSLDQLSPSRQATSLLWLPRVLPANVRLVVSTLPDSERGLLTTLRSIVTQPSHFVDILPLGSSVGLNALHCWMSEANRTVTDEQMVKIKKALAACSLPLYMKLIFDKVTQWRSYAPPDDTVIEATVKGVIHSLFDRVEKYHGSVYVKHALSYMTVSKYGLSDVEMEDLLSLDDAVLDTVFTYWIPPVRRLPPVLLPRLYTELRPYVTLREANGHAVFYWYHRQFIDAVTQRYLGHLQHRQYIHSILADYFLGRWGGGAKKPYYLSERLMALLGQSEKLAYADRKVSLQPLVFGAALPSAVGEAGSGGSRPRVSNATAVRYNLRKLSELPHHLIESKRYAELRDEVLFNYNWIYTKVKATSLQDVLADFRAAITAGVNDRATQTVYSALRVGGHVLAGNPETLAFELLARLLSHYDQWKYIARLLQQCDLDAGSQPALLPVYQCYEAPRGALLYILDHVSTVVVNVAFSTSTNELICACADRTIGFWNMETGERVRDTTIPEVAEAKSLTNMKLYLSSDGSLLTCDPGSNGSPVFIYDVNTGCLLHTVGEKLPQLKRTFQAGDLLCRQKSVIDMRTGKVVADLDDLIPSKKFVVCNITPNEKFIVYGENDRINVFDMAKKVCVAKMTCSHPPSVIAITSDSCRAFVGFTTSCALKVFDIDAASTTIGRQLMEFNYSTAFSNMVSTQGNRYFQEVAEIALLHMHPADKAAKCNVALLNIKRSILAIVSVNAKGSAAGNPVLLDTSSKEIQAEGGSELCDIAVVADGYAIARCGGLLCVWSIETGNLLTFLRPHSAGKLAVAVSGANFAKSLVATSSFIQAAVKVWDLRLSRFQDDGTQASTVYECPVSRVAAAPDRRLLFVKHSKSLDRSDGYRLLDHFGIDVWNLSTGRSYPCLPFHQYGRLLQMEVSRSAVHLGLLLVTRDEAYVAVLGLRSDVRPLVCLPHWSAKSFAASAQWRFIATYAKETCEMSVKLWEVTTGTELKRFEGASSPAFTFDERHLLLLQDGRLVVVQLTGHGSTPQQPEIKTSFECDAVSLQVIPARSQWVLSLTAAASADSEFATVTIWDFTTGSRVLSINNVAPHGICDFSKDGRLMIDGYLQVFDVETGHMAFGLQPIDRDSDATFVRLTHDGLYAIVVDVMTVCVYRVRDGKVVARTSTHEKVVSLEMFDFGYLHAIGREDGYINITKLVTDSWHSGGTAIENISERSRLLLRASTCLPQSIATQDAHFRRSVDEAFLPDLPTIRAEVYASMTARANKPMVIALRPRVNSQGNLSDFLDGPMPVDMRQVLESEKQRTWGKGTLGRLFRRSREYAVSAIASDAHTAAKKDRERESAKSKTLDRPGIGSGRMPAKGKFNSMHDVCMSKAVVSVGTMVLSVAEMAARSETQTNTLDVRTNRRKSRSPVFELFKPATGNGHLQDDSYVATRTAL